MSACKEMNQRPVSIEGLNDFQGKVLRGAEAALQADVRDLRVAVIGDGALELETVPELVGVASRVKVFQRHPVWILPELNYLWSVLPETWLERVARAHLHRQVRDPWIRRQLTPDNPLKRRCLVVSSRYYPALLEPGCELITWPVVRVCKHGIRTAEGLEHRFDCIVIADS
jgi:cation diffusion facilitator CzcD-associated flavoprotein CzcO